MNDEYRKAEQDKYINAYQKDNYRMGGLRKADAERTVQQLMPTSMLDVGCGRGEMLDFAKSLGADTVIGIEVVPQLVAARDDVLPGEGWQLPFDDNSFDVVTCFDVMEHLLPGDDILTLQELSRVASRAVAVSANNKDSWDDGVQLHINKRPYPEWERLIIENVPGVIHKCDVNYVSPLWVVQLF